MLSLLVFADRSLWTRMIEEAQQHAEREACGLLLGQRSEACDPPRRIVTEVQPTRNTAARPETRYEVDVQALFRAHREEREGGPSLLGVYHSHPAGDALPSPTDLELAWPGYAYVIVGRDRKARAWRLRDGEFEEEEVRVGGRLHARSAMLGSLKAVSILVTLYLVLAGLALILFPWSPYWEDNVIVQFLGADFPGSFSQHALRFFLTFFGALHLVLAADDLLRVIHREGPAAPG